MTTPTTERRKTLQNTDHAHLEGRMDLLDRKINEVEEAVERLDKKLDSQDSKLDKILDSIRSIELGNKDRERDHALLAKDVSALQRKIGAVSSNTGETGAKGDKGERGEQGHAAREPDELVKIYNKVKIYASIAGMLLFLLFVLKLFEISGIHLDALFPTK